MGTITPEELHRRQSKSVRAWVVRVTNSMEGPLRNARFGNAYVLATGEADRPGQSGDCTAIEGPQCNCAWGQRGSEQTDGCIIGKCHFCFFELQPTVDQEAGKLTACIQAWKAAGVTKALQGKLFGEWEHFVPEGFKPIFEVDESEVLYTCSKVCWLYELVLRQCSLVCRVMTTRQKNTSLSHRVYVSGTVALICPRTPCFLSRTSRLFSAEA